MTQFRIFKGATMLKQVLRVLTVLAVLLLLASPASANQVSVILDDPIYGGTFGAPWVLPYGSNNPYNMMWQTCTGPNSPVPGNEPAATGNYQDCLAITNLTGSAITNLILTIPDSISTDTFACTVPPPVNPATATGFSCFSSNVGGLVTLDFLGIPGFQPSTTIFIGVGLPGENVGGLGNPTGYVPTHDPSTLVLLGVGMAMLAMGGLRRYA